MHIIDATPPATVDRGRWREAVMSVLQWSRRVGVLLAAVTATVALSGTPAHAATFDQWFPTLTSCSSNVRIGDVMSIYDDSGKYYGWAEWRYGTYSLCQYYQWVVLHVTTTLKTDDYYYYVALTPQSSYGGFTSMIPAPYHSGGYGVFTANTYPSQMIYARTVVICAATMSFSVDSSYHLHYLFFGHSGVQYAWCA
jgi:hypothetical protein